MKTTARKRYIFWDDNLGANRAYAKELFAAIAPLKRWWTSQCTADVAFDDEFMSLAARSGCKALFLGLEPSTTARKTWYFSRR